MEPVQPIQLELLGGQTPIVHYFDRNGALHSGRLIRRITKGKRKGQVVVLDQNGRRIIPYKVRNIEYIDQ